MAIKLHHIAVVCNYQLLPNRIGGMDYFFWAFDAACKKEGIAVDWFFPNRVDFGGYKDLCIIPNDGRTVEHHFINYLDRNTVDYSHIVTHFVELCTSFYKAIKKNQQVKIIAVDHNPRPLNGYTLQKRLKKRIKGVLYSNYIDVFVGVSEYSKIHLLNDYGKTLLTKIEIIYNGVNEKELLQKKEFNFKGKFIVACHLRKEKGVQYLIDAISNLEKELLNNVSIDIYGGGPYESFLKQKSKYYNLESIINFKGSTDALNTLYCKYDYLIHPSLGETFCYSVVEAVLSNLPVITTANAGNVLGLIKNGINGCLFNERDSDNLSLIIKRIISKEIDISSADMDSVKQPDLSLSNMVDKHLELVKNVI